MQVHSAETLACELLMYQNINLVEQQLITLNILFIILSVGPICPCNCDALIRAFRFVQIHRVSKKRPTFGLL